MNRNSYILNTSSNRKKIIRLAVKIFTLLFASTLLYGSYGKFKEVITWLPWYFNGANVLEISGILENVAWDGGKRSCNC